MNCRSSSRVSRSYLEISRHREKPSRKTVMHRGRTMIPRGVGGRPRFVAEVEGGPVDVRLESETSPDDVPLSVLRRHRLIHTPTPRRWAASPADLLLNLRPDLQNILRLSHDYLTIMPKLRSTYDERLLYITSREERKAFLRYNSLAKL